MAKTQARETVVIGTATDTRYAMGQVGLRSWGATGYFDEVSVQSV